MRILTQNGWEEQDWEIGYPLPDHHTASQMFLGANDIIPNMNDDDVNDVIYLIEKPVNEALQDNEDSNPADQWRLCGLVFQKTSMVDTDEENTSLAGESIEMNVVNDHSDETEHPLPVLFRRMLPIEALEQAMDATEATGDERIPDEVLDICKTLDIGIATEVVVTEETQATVQMALQGLKDSDSQDIEKTT